MQEFLTTNDETIVQLKMDKTDSDSIEGLDIDINIPTLHLQLHQQLIDQLLGVISLFHRRTAVTGRSLSESVIKAVSRPKDDLKWLRIGEEFRQDNAIDYSEVISLIRQVIDSFISF